MQSETVRIQALLGQEEFELLCLQAEREHVSRSELIRRALRTYAGSDGLRIEDDPAWKLLGIAGEDTITDGSTRVDEVVYGGSPAK